jgi:hypothetical protein
LKLYPSVWAATRYRPTLFFSLRTTLPLPRTNIFSCSVTSFGTCTLNSIREPGGIAWSQKKEMPASLASRVIACCGARLPQCTSSIRRTGKRCRSRLSGRDSGGIDRDIRPKASPLPTALSITSAFRFRNNSYTFLEEAPFSVIVLGFVDALLAETRSPRQTISNYCDALALPGASHTSGANHD